MGKSLVWIFQFRDQYWLHVQKKITQSVFGITIQDSKNYQECSTLLIRKLKSLLKIRKHCSRVQCIHLGTIWLQAFKTRSEWCMFFMMSSEILRLLIIRHAARWNFQTVGIILFVLIKSKSLSIWVTLLSKSKNIQYYLMLKFQEYPSMIKIPS
jgi:hypothetical protein